jgi:hypothetical protein
MKMSKSSLLCILVLSFPSLISAQEARRLHPDSALSLRDGWNLQSSCKVEAKGETVSTPAFQPKDWYAVTVPTTVVAALVQHNVYPDPFFGTNLRTFPGVTYPVGTNFSGIPMQADSPFIVPWWYRKEFRRSVANLRVRHYRLCRPGKAERSCPASLLPHRHRPGHHVRRLEPRASRQEHGPLSRRGYHYHWARGFALPRCDLKGRFSGQRQGPPPGHRASEERCQSSG